MDRPIAIPRILGIAWWWLIVAYTVEMGIRDYFHWHQFAWVDILEIWIFVQALWLKKAVPQSRAIYWLAASTLFGIGLDIARHHTRTPNWLVVTIGLVAVVIGVIGTFACRWAMERYFNETDPVGLKLDGFMTFFFNVLYFQYHFHDIYRYKQDKEADRLSITPSAG